MKNNSYLIKAALATFLLSTTLASNAFARFSKEDIKLDTSWLTGSVLEEAEALTKSLKRDITVYSWVDQKNIKGFETGRIDVRNSEFLNMTWDNSTDRMSRFWNTTDSVSGRSAEGGAMAPNGLYVATEPVISKPYGTVAYRMVLPQGTKFIDGRYRQNPILGKNLQKALLERGCSNPLRVDAKNPVFAARNLIKSDTKQIACRQALAEIAEAVHAKAVLYIFKAEPVPFCNRTYAWNSAFVLIDDSVVKEGSFQPLVSGQSNKEDGLEQERQLMNGVFANAKLGKIFPQSETASTSDAAEFMQDNYFACNAKIREW